jgi:hypothetical protein
MRINLPILGFWQTENLSLERGRHAIAKEHAIFVRVTAALIDL